MTATKSPYRSQAEKKLQSLLLTEPLSASPKCNFYVAGYHADFFFQEWKLVVELDSDWHDPIKDQRIDTERAHCGIATLRLPFDLATAELRHHIKCVAHMSIGLGAEHRIAAVSAYRRMFVNVPRSTQNVQNVHKGANPLCLDCGGTGWKDSMYYSQRKGCAMASVTKCKCANLAQPEPKRDLLTVVLEQEQWERQIQETLDRINHPAPAPRQEVMTFVIENMKKPPEAVAPDAPALSKASGARI